MPLPSQTFRNVFRESQLQLFILPWLFDGFRVLFAFIQTFDLGLHLPPPPYSSRRESIDSTVTRETFAASVHGSNNLYTTSGGFNPDIPLSTSRWILQCTMKEEGPWPRQTFLHTIRFQTSTTKTTIPSTATPLSWVTIIWGGTTQGATVNWIFTFGDMDARRAM